MICNRLTPNMLFKQFLKAVVYKIPANSSSRWWRGSETMQQVLPGTVFSIAQISDIENSIRLKYSQRVVIRPVTMEKLTFVFSCAYSRRKMIDSQPEVVFAKIRADVDQPLHKATVVARKTE